MSEKYLGAPDTLTRNVANLLYINIIYQWGAQGQANRRWKMDLQTLKAFQL